MISDPDVAATLLHPTRSRILTALSEPGSATTVSAAISETRQRVNYHLRSLEDHGLVQLVEQRPRRGLVERVMQASARAYVLSPSVLGHNAAEPSRTDRHSTSYLIAVAARLVREVAELARGAERSARPLATLTIDTEIRFASASERAAFTDELSATVRSLAARYHDEKAPQGRAHRLIVAAHPSPPPQSHNYGSNDNE